MSTTAATFPPPTVAYPNSIKTGSSSQSRGSFGPVFVVLAVITVLAAIACFLGRIVARRYFRPRAKREHVFQSGGDVEGGVEMHVSPPTRATMNDSGVKREVKPADIGVTKMARPPANGVERGA